MRHYVLEGKTPIPVSDFTEWAVQLEITNRKVNNTVLENETHISTVFLGLDHSWDGGPPLLFETMIFGGEHDGYQERCSTWDEAEIQHEIAVELAKSE